MNEWTFEYVGSPVIMAVHLMPLKLIDSVEIWYEWHTIMAIAHENRIKYKCLSVICGQILHRYLYETIESIITWQATISCNHWIFDWLAKYSPPICSLRSIALELRAVWILSIRWVWSVRQTISNTIKLHSIRYKTAATLALDNHETP